MTDLDSKNRRLFDFLGGVESTIVGFQWWRRQRVSRVGSHSGTRVGGVRDRHASPSYPDHHRQLALDVARRFKLHHHIIPPASSSGRSTRIR